jgi:hypothetical protein
MAKKPRKIDLGVFMAGEIPFPIDHIYKRRDKTIIDISGWTLVGFSIEGPDGSANLGSGTFTFTGDGSDGSVTYNWIEDDLQTFGKYEGTMWIQNLPSAATRRLASDLFAWEVYDGPLATPSN